MTTFNIPIQLKDISPDWLTDALRSSKVIKRASVTDIDLEQVGGGYLGMYARLRLEYDVLERDVPKSMFLKLPSQNPALREFSVAAGLYKREVLFYQSLAPMLGVSVPKCYFSMFDEETGDFVILLEDVPIGGPDRVPLSCTFNDARAVVTRLARMHARWWESPELARYDWLSPVDSLRDIVQERYSGWLAKSVRKIAKHSDHSLSKVGRTIGANIEYVLERLSEHPQTLVHGDFWISKVLFSGINSDEFTFIDWQFVGKGRGALDAGYFMWSLPVSERRTHESTLMRMYHAELVANGVEGYTFDDAWQDYRLSWLYSFIMFVWSISDVDLTESEDAKALVQYLERIMVGIADLGSLDALRG